MTPEIARQLNLRIDGGCVVVRVEDGSSAAEAGVQRGDVIREINGQNGPDDGRLRAAHP